MCPSPTCVKRPVSEKATGTLLDEVCESSAETIAAAVASAREAGKQWRRRPISERVQILEDLRRLVLSQATAISELISRENGKPCHESLTHEIIPLLDAIGWLTANASNVLGEVTLTPRWLKHRAHQISRRPHGVTAIIAPFNFPWLIAAIDSLTALVAGCSVILKPSEHCPLSATRFVALAHQAGIPTALLQMVNGDAKVGQLLLESPIDAVVFTGNIENGRKVAVSCASRLIACTLELGGNCPVLVLGDADLERTARAILFGALSNSGQTCLGVGRVLVPRPLQERLADLLVELIRPLRQGNPFGGDVHLGSLTTVAQIERCRSHVTQAQMTGSTLRCGGSTLDGPGLFFQPTLLTHCHPQQLVYQHETFGPVIALLPYDDEIQAVELLNSDPAGLAAYVFGASVPGTLKVAEALDFGQVVVDHILLTYVCPEVPLSGLRQSGIGTVHGRDGLLGHSTPQVLATPKMRLPAEVEFATFEPHHARSIAQAYLSTTNAVERAKTQVGRFFRR